MFGKVLSHVCMVHDGSRWPVASPLVLPGMPLALPALWPPNPRFCVGGFLGVHLEKSVILTIKDWGFFKGPEKKWDETGIL